VALCTDVGISAAVGAAMLSMLLGFAFLSRQIWGLVADRIGGLRTIFAGSVCQLVAMVGFLSHPERGRALHRLGRIRPRLQRHHPSVCAGCA